MEKMQVDPNVSGVAIQRIEALNRILSGKEPVRVDEVAIRLEGPDYGWLDMYFIVTDKKPFMLEISDVYPPFKELRDWLEHMVHFNVYNSGGFSIDSEGYSVFLSYDYLGHYEINKIDEPVALLQIADDLLEKYRVPEYEHTLQLIVPIRTFVADMYYGLKNHMQQNTDVFSEHWDRPDGDGCDVQELIEAWTSADIEYELDEMNKYSDSLGTWPLIRIR